MATRRLTLIEILHPPSFASNPKRTEATRTIIQPEIDAFESAETRLPERGKNRNALALASPPNLAPRPNF